MPQGNPYGGYSGTEGSGNTSVSGSDGLGLYDLYNQFSYISTMFGPPSEYGDDMASSLQAYDTFNEDLLRDKYRQDFRDMTSNMSSLQKNQAKELGSIRGKHGKAGFAGSGGAATDLSDANKKYSLGMSDIHESMKSQRGELITNINKERQAYSDELWTAYGTWLSQSPENMLSEEDAMSNDTCYAAGGFINSEGQCVYPEGSDYEFDQVAGNEGLYEQEFEDWMSSLIGGG